MEKIIVGMSGGVDSSVACYLLKERGYDVIGVTMNVWDNPNNEAILDAKNICKKLNVEHYVLDFRQEFKNQVMEYFKEEYINGRTPNPCVVCNRKIKWEALLGKANELGCDKVATGHYARIERYSKTGRLTLRESSVLKKDQSYVLYNLTQNQLSKTVMPIGEFSKETVKEIARGLELKIAKKPESQDICFIPNGDYVSFLKNQFNVIPKAGNYIDKSGNILGRHKGIVNYTIGQRKGLGIALGHHVFVNQILPNTNEVVLGSNEELFKTRVYANKVNLMAVESIDSEIRLLGKLRYAHKKSPCTVRFVDDDILECVFDEPQRAPAPGQSLVLYDNEYVFGGGTIIDAK